MSVEEINRFLEDDLDDEEQELQDNRQEYLDTNLYQAARDGRAEVIEGIIVLYDFFDRMIHTIWSILYGQYHMGKIMCKTIVRYLKI